MGSGASCHAPRVVSELSGLPFRLVSFVTIRISWIRLQTDQYPTPHLAVMVFQLCPDNTTTILSLSFYSFPNLWTFRFSLCSLFILPLLVPPSSPAACILYPHPSLSHLSLFYFLSYQTRLFPFFLSSFSSLVPFFTML